MKYIKSILIIIGIFLIVISCGITNTNTNNKPKLNQYPDLDVSIESYFHQNFKYPDDINILVNFIDNNKYYKESYDNIIKQGTENFKVGDSSGYFTIHYKKTNVLTKGKIDICTSLKKKRLRTSMLYTTLVYDEGEKIEFNEDQKKDEDSLNMKVFEILNSHKKNSDFTFEFVKIYSDSIYFECGVKNYNKSYSNEIKKVFNNYINETKSDSIKVILPFI